MWKKCMKCSAFIYEKQQHTFVSECKKKSAISMILKFQAKMMEKAMLTIDEAHYTATKARRAKHDTTSVHPQYVQISWISHILIYCQPVWIERIFLLLLVSTDFSHHTLRTDCFILTKDNTYTLYKIIITIIITVITSTKRNTWNERYENIVTNNSIFVKKNGIAESSSVKWLDPLLLSWFAKINV